MKKYGFTGNRTGMSDNQKEQIRTILQTDLNNGFNIQVAHGDCVGADKDFHDICCELSIDNRIKIIIHPPTENILRAFCKSDNIMICKPYLDRNRDIVDTSDTLLACPKTNIEEKRSGTWYTIRYARKKNKPILIIV
jgi:hypothetical protein